MASKTKTENGPNFVAGKWSQNQAGFQAPRLGGSQFCGRKSVPESSRNPTPKSGGVPLLRPARATRINPEIETADKVNIKFGRAPVANFGLSFASSLLWEEAPRVLKFIWFQTFGSWCCARPRERCVGRNVNSKTQQHNIRQHKN